MQAAFRCTIVATSAVMAITLCPTSIDEEPALRALPARHAALDDGDPLGSSAISADAAAGNTAAFQRVFDLTALTERQASWARSTLAGACDYDWSRLLPRLGDRRVRVTLGEPPARAMFYPEGPRVEIHRFFYRHERAAATRLLAWETAHAVDLFALSDDQRTAIIDLYHDSGDAHGWLDGEYDEQVGEAFMEGFTAAFCPSLSASRSTFSHETTPAIAEELRRTI